MKERHSVLKYLKSSLLFFLFSVSLTAQSVVTINNEQGEALVGVSVVAENTTFFSVSDAEGEVSIPVTVATDVLLEFTYLGYQTVKLTKAQLEEAGFTVVMKEGLFLDEVTIVGRTDTRSNTLLNEVQVIKAENINSTNPQSTADALGQHADVYIQKSQMGGGSPVIRGFEANKVLLVVDGIRMNNAIYRNGHLQNAITVDNSILDRMEVIYGPGSLMYGSDALGGVIHFRSRRPQFNFDPEKSLRVKTHLMSRYASANDEKTFHADINIGGSKVASLTSISFSDFGDLRAGGNRSSEYPEFGKRSVYQSFVNGEDVIIQNDDPNVQTATAYHQVDFSQKLSFQPNKKLLFSADFQFSTSSDIPRYDRLIEESDDTVLEFAEWYYGPQKRMLGALRAEYTDETPLFNKMIVIASHQNISEDRIDRKFGSSQKGHQEETVKIWSLTADFIKNMGASGNQELHYGFEWNDNDVQSVAFNEDITSGNISFDAFTRYPDGSSGTGTIGVYGLYKIYLGSESQLFGGLRFTGNRLDVKYDRTDLVNWPASFTDGLTSNNEALTWSLGYDYKQSAGWHIKAMLSSAFRSPNIDDMAKIRVKSDEISVPNLELQPEKSINAEITIAKKINNNLKISASAFYTDLSDVIIREDLPLPDGTPYIIDEGDTLKTVANINAVDGNIFGVSLNVKSQVTDKLSFKASYNYIRGRQMSNGEESTPLAHIPPMYGSLGLTYKMEKAQAILNVKYNGKKPIDLFGDSTDNPDLATEEGSPSWYTINAYYNHSLTKQLKLSLGLENILDKYYRPFASGLGGPGRNAIIALRMVL